MGWKMGREEEGERGERERGKRMEWPMESVKPRARNVAASPLW